jgi:hypothetical protein
VRIGGRPVKTRNFVAAAILLAAASGPAAAQKYAAVISGDTPLPAFCAGRTTMVSMHLGNNGVGLSATWTTDIYHLAYHWKQGGAYVVYDGDRTILPTQVPAGGHVSLGANVKAPASPGTYTLIFDMVAEGVTWFETQGSKTWSQTVEVQSVAQCSLNASVQAMPAALLPKIDGCFPGTETGGFVVCWGQNFGATKGTGKILMKGLPGGDVDLSAQPNLKWNDTSFYAQVPPNLSGFKEQKVRIQVVTAAHGSTNEFAIDIKPALDVQAVVGTLFKSSSTDSDCFCIVSEGTDGIAGGHAGNLFGDNGTDTWKGARLANGWLYHSMDLNQLAGFANFPLYEGGTTPDLGDVPQVTITIKWSYDNGFVSAAYSIVVYAIGPRGMPMQ